MATSYLQIENLTKSYGDRILFEDVTLGIFEGDKIGLIAKNGTGKSTLLRIIAGKEECDSGNVVFRSGLRVGILDQTPTFNPSHTVLEACLEDYHPEAHHEEWDAEDRAKQLLGQLGLHDLTLSVGVLSGGQNKRLALAQLLLNSPELIILDEPTNHLDISTIEWLENYLSRQRITLLLVTHDRYFLDRVTNKIIEIDNQRVYTYEGNYNNYLRRREERIEAMSAELSKVKNTLRKEQEWMRRQPQARAGKAKYRIDAFYDLKERSRVNLKENNVELNVKSSYIGSKIFEAEHISKRFGDKVILDDFTYTFARYEKVGIVGNNGTGKSTFIKMLQGIEPVDRGTWNVGETVRFGYYSQQGIQFNESKKVIDAVTEIADDIVVNDNVRYSPMQFLTHFLFSPADQQKYISTLSGGEKARLYLATVLMRSPNFLILDEPTNDLDIITLSILEDYLQSFKGCVIVVSHDRFFLDSIVDHLFVFEGDGVIKDFPGNYSEYRNYLVEQNKTQVTSKTIQQAEQPRPKRERDANKMTYKERIEFASLEKEIQALTEEKASLEALFNSGETIEDILEKSRRYDEVKEILDEKELRWLELSEKN